MSKGKLKKIIPKGILLDQISMGVSKRQMADNLQCSRSTIEKNLSYYGIDYRNRKETKAVELFVPKQNKCLICGKMFDKYAVIDGRKVDLRKRQHCLDCLPYKQGSGSLRKKEEIQRNCKMCGKPLKSRHSTYCSNTCYQRDVYESYIQRWKNGEETGIVGDEWKDVSLYIKRYLFEKYNNQCAECGWSKINPFTNTLPLEIEHIDGNALNNDESNLTLLCPNCHSLTKTYRGANKGNGKRNIKWLSRSGKD